MGRRRKEPTALPDRCYRLPSGSVQYRPLHGKTQVIATKSASIDEVWREYKRLAERQAKNTLAYIADQYYASNAFAALKKSTQDDYRIECSKTPLKAFAGWDASDIEPSDIDLYMTTRAKTSIRRANMELVWFKNVFACAFRQGIVKPNPAIDLKPLRLTPEQRKAKRKVYVTDRQYYRMLARSRVNRKWTAITCAMEISYCTGIRQGDLLKMRWEDIGEALYIEEGKTDREYLKTVSPRLKRALDRAKRLPGQPFSGWVIRNRAGNRYTSKGFQASWKHVKARSPVDFRWHDIRHKAISDAASGKKQAFSMHRDAKMLGVYDHELAVSPSH